MYDNAIARVISLSMSISFLMATVTWGADDKTPPKPPPPKDTGTELIIGKGGKPPPKPPIKSEIYLITSKDGETFLLDGIQLRNASKPPPTCKKECVRIKEHSGAVLDVPIGSLSKFSIPAKHAFALKESLQKFGSGPVNWTPPADYKERIPKGSTLIPVGAVGPSCMHHD